MGFEDSAIFERRHVCDCDGPCETHIPNLALLSGLYSIVDKLIDITNTDTVNGFCSYIEVGLSSTTPVNSQTALVLPFARRPINSASRSSTNAVFGVFFSGVVGNTASTTVLTGASTTVFDVQAGLGASFAAGQTIKVGSEIKIISTVVSDTITLTTALTSTPTPGTTVDQCYAELGLFGGSTATTTLGSGIAFARTVSFTPEPKPAGYGATVEWVVALT